MALTKVTRSGITDDSINADKIEDGTIVDADITPGTITNAKLAGSIANAKLANSSITVNGSSVSLGGSFTAGSLSWQSIVVSDGSTVTTMVAGRGYFVDNTSAAGLVKLPASASAGDTIAIKDYAGNFGTNNLTIQRNSHKIQGVENDSQLLTNKASVTLVYIDSTKGWLFTNESNVADLERKVYTAATGGTVATSGDFKIHSFTGDGCFVVSTAPVGPGTAVDYVVVAGGGGGAWDRGGGGGAGGYRESSGNSGPYTASPLATPTGITVTASTFPITVGAGGVGGTSPSQFYGGKGSNSVFSTITSAGGGGGSFNPTGDHQGGSGGGFPGGSSLSDWSPPANNGNHPPVSPPQGNTGGNGGTPGPSGLLNAGGGGGATAVGANATAGSGGGNGGAGATSHITGSPVTRSGGGGGSRAFDANPNGSGTSGTGGSGGGGAAAPSAGTNGSAGTSNTGGGGGGAANNPSPGSAAGAGGKGVVILRYRFQQS